jgi:hypothetical protein
MRWIPASERLGEFKDSDINSWKFFNVDFCKVDNEPMEGGFFRKDTKNNTIIFSYVYIGGTTFRREIKEKDFHRIKWLDESPDSNADDQDQFWMDIDLSIRGNGKDIFKKLKSKYTITKKQ